MRFEELNWMDIENYLRNDNRLIFVIGACEQHGYLSLLTDVKIPMSLADAASNQTGVLIAPPLNFGCSPYFLSYPGTINLRVETLLHIVEDLVKSFYLHGFRKILVLNGHGGNIPVKTHLYELANNYDQLIFSWYEWWKSPAVEGISRKYNLKPAHANWLEAFNFTKVTELPSGEKPEVIESPIRDHEEMKLIYGDGSFGGRYSVSDAIMDELFKACLDEVIELLKFETTL